MLKQLINVKSNKIFVLQNAGKGTSCLACVWQTDLHTGTAALCEPALSLLHRTAAIYLYGFPVIDKVLMDINWLRTESSSMQFYICHDALNSY